MKRPFRNLQPSPSLSGRYCRGAPPHSLCELQKPYTSNTWARCGLHRKCWSFRPCEPRTWVFPPSSPALACCCCWGVMKTATPFCHFTAYWCDMWSCFDNVTVTHHGRLLTIRQTFFSINACTVVKVIDKAVCWWVHRYDRIATHYELEYVITSFLHHKNDQGFDLLKLGHHLLIMSEVKPLQSMSWGVVVFIPHTI